MWILNGEHSLGETESIPLTVKEGITPLLCHLSCCISANTLQRGMHTHTHTHCKSVCAFLIYMTALTLIACTLTCQIKCLINNQVYQFPQLWVGRYAWFKYSRLGFSVRFDWNVAWISMNWILQRSSLPRYIYNYIWLISAEYFPVMQRQCQLPQKRDMHKTAKRK